MNKYYNTAKRYANTLDELSRRHCVEILARDAELFESVLAALNEGVLVTDDDKRLIYANSRAEDFFAFRLSEAKGKRVEDFLHFDLFKAQLCEITLTYPQRRQLALHNITDGKVHVTLVHDVTLEREEFVSSMEQASTRAVEQLASSVAHEIGNPLNALSLNMQLLERELKKEPDEARRERLLNDVASARGEITRLDGILRSFLSALRPREIKLSPMSIADVVKRMLSVMKAQFEARHIAVTLDLPRALPTVLIDAEQMEQVFFNLSKNSLEAMKDGGELAYAITADDEYVNVTLRDNGIGMDAQTLAHLFEPYHTTKQHGNGLGMMVCRRIVRAHGGTIEVQSEKGHGTCFTIRLPRATKRIREIEN